MTTARFPVRFDAWYRVLSSGLFLPPSKSYVEVGPDEVSARMGWAFRTTFPRKTVTSVEHSDARPMSRGVHGFGGRWLVNGSADGILTIKLDPEQRAWVIGAPIRLRELMVSVEDPEGLERALRAVNPEARSRT